MNRFFYGAAVAIFAGLPANAADMARPMPVKAPVAAAPLWAGWYVGAHGGYGWGDPEATVDPASAPLPAGAITNFAPAAPFMLSTEPRGGFGGGQVGYNWMFNRTVLGIEADASISGMKDTASGSYINLFSRNGDDARTVGTASLETKVDAFGTVRGRVGYAFDRFLPYVTGGLAWGHVKTTVTNSGAHYDIGGGLPGTLISTFNASASSTDLLWGFAVGAGGELAIDNRWSVRGEYLFVRLTEGADGLSVPGITVTDSKVQMHLARAAVNYRFAP